MATILLGIVFSFPIKAVSAEVEGSVANPDMVLIPGGTFTRGSTEKDIQWVAEKFFSATLEWYRDETPAHEVDLKAYYIDRYEVTNVEFLKFREAVPGRDPKFMNNPRFNKLRHPIVGIAWQEAVDYCRWAEKRLPTEAEWERAARGTDDRIYPWGNEPPDPSRSNFGRCCFVMKGLVFNDVGNLKAGKTPNNIFDLAGNVAEWVFDWYDKNYYKVSPRKNPKGPEKGRYHIIRGGAWNSFPGYLRSSARYGYNDAKDFYGIGCRCAKSAEE